MSEDKKEPEVKGNNKIDMGMVASWGLGGIFLLAGLGNITDPESATMGTAFLIASCFLLPPIRNFFHKKTDKTLSAGIRAIIVIVLLGVGAGESSTGTSAVFEGTVSAESNAQTDKMATKLAEQNVSNTADLPKCPDRRDNLMELIMSPDSYYNAVRDPAKTLPEFKRKELYRSLTGKPVVWIGWVDDIKEKMLGGYEVVIDADQPEQEASVPEIYFKTDRETALTLEKDNIICFSGVIKSLVTVFEKPQATLDNVTIEKVYEY